MSDNIGNVSREPSSSEEHVKNLLMVVRSLESRIADLLAENKRIAEGWTIENNQFSKELRALEAENARLRKVIAESGMVSVVLPDEGSVPNFEELDH